MNSIYESMSQAELLVCDFLKSKRIFWTYEQPVFLSDDNNRPRIFCPDFYLPELGIYIEVIGNPNLNDYERRENIYEKNNIAIIFITLFNNKSWERDLLNEINEIHNRRYEKLKRINRCY